MAISEKSRQLYDLMIGKGYSLAYYLSYEEILALADDGITQGYVTLDELDEVDPYEYGIDRKDLVFIVRIC